MKKMMIMAAACMMAAMTFAAQCAAKTEDGVQCKRQAEENSKYCWQHADYKPAAKTEAKKPAKKSEAKPAAKSTEKPAAKSTEKPAAKSAGKPAAKKPAAK